LSQTGSSDAPEHVTGIAERVVGMRRAIAMGAKRGEGRRRVTTLRERPQALGAGAALLSYNARPDAERAT